MALNLDHKVKIKVSVQPYLTLGPDDDGDAKNVPNIEIPTLSGVSTIDLSTFPWDNGSTGEYRWFYDPFYQATWSSGNGRSLPTGSSFGLFTDGHVPDLSDRVLFVYIKNLDMDEFKKPHGKEIYISGRGHLGFDNYTYSSSRIKAGESMVYKYGGPNIDNTASLIDEQVGNYPAYIKILAGRQEDEITGNVALVELLYLARTEY